MNGSAWDLTSTPGFTTSLPLAQSTIDLDVAGRSDERVVERALDDPATRVMFVDGPRVAVWRSDGAQAPDALACDADPAAPRPDASAPVGHLSLVLLAGPEVRAEALSEGALAVYLGCDRSEAPEVRYVALDVTRLGKRVGRRHADDLRSRLDASCDWIELRSFAPCASAREAGLAVSAVAVCSWHASQRFCPACGAPTRPILAGWAQGCTNPDDADRLLFPRIEPAVITAIVDDADRILLQHNRAWRPRFHSVSAGFVEAGESLEHAVRREAAEEVGIALGDVVYLGSQPWPFPASIMLAFRARALGSMIAVDGDEVESARWFTRDELIRAVASGDIEPPGRASIARHMIESWLGRKLA